MRPGGKRDNARLAPFDGAEGITQSAAQGEVPEVIVGEVQFPTIRGAGQAGRDDARVVDQQVQRAVSALDKAGYCGAIGQVQGGDVHTAATSRLPDVPGGLEPGPGVTDRQGDIRAGPGERTGSLQTDAGRGPGD